MEERQINLKTYFSSSHCPCHNSNRSEIGQLNGLSLSRPQYIHRQYIYMVSKGGEGINIHE